MSESRTGDNEGGGGLSRPPTRRSALSQNYSLAGPRPNFSNVAQVPEESGIDLGYSNGQLSRPQPKYGLGKPFPRANNQRWAKKKAKKEKSQGASDDSSMRPVRTHVERKSEDGHPEGQVGGGPSGHHGSPVRGRPIGEVAGGPAVLGRNEDEDETGHANLIESLADEMSGRGRARRTKSDQTLVGPDDEDDEFERIPNFWFAVRRQIREPLAEWLATLVSVLIGVCGNLQVTTSQGESGTYTQSAAMWGLGIMMAIYIAGGVSGAHVNPMVSISLMVFRGFPFRKCVIYIVAQTVGAICAVWIAYGIYKDAILNFDPNKTSTTDGSGTAFFTLPASFASPATAFMTDFTSAAVLSGSILAVGDDTNSPPGAGMHAFILGLIVFALAATFGYNTGPQTNPAKDLATRVVPNAVGYGSDMWQRAWWVEAWVAAIFGGLAGCLIYDLAIFEGPESPVNYPKIRRKNAEEKEKPKNEQGWLSNAIFGRFKKNRVKEDLENGNASSPSKNEERRADSQAGN